MSWDYSIKLADRLHNMRTLDYLPEEKRRRIAQETMDLYAPMAHRFGMAQVRWELEDLSFKYLEPADYKSLAKLVTSKRGHCARAHCADGGSARARPQGRRHQGRRGRRPAEASLVDLEERGARARRPVPDAPRRDGLGKDDDRGQRHSSTTASPRSSSRTTRRSPRSCTANSSGFFPNNAVEYFVSYYDYYQPEAYVPSSDTYIEKDASINEDIDRLRLRRDLAAHGARRCDHRRHGERHLRARRSRGIPRAHGQREGGRRRAGATSCCARSSASSMRATMSRSNAAPSACAAIRWRLSAYEEQAVRVELWATRSSA